MRVIIAGSRSIVRPEPVIEAVRLSGFAITEVVSGACPHGVDAQGEWLAHQIGLPVTRFPADWKSHGKRAGPLRNAEMARYAQALVAVWDGRSRGTADMIRQAHALGLSVFVYAPD